tara:strand:- start:316 stop:741 length:426 start_codon:yes stop_codon:yes gene_type:complete
MIKPCLSIGRLYQVSSGSTLPLTKETIVNSGTRVLLSSFSFTANLQGVGNYYNVPLTDAPNFYSRLPHVTFMNGDESIVFGSVASLGVTIANLGGDKVVNTSINIPGRGILFDGLIISVQDDALSQNPNFISYGLNVIYQV